MDLEGDMLCAIDLALADDADGPQAAELLAGVCYRYARQHRFELPSIIWSFVAWSMRDPDYLASERRKSELAALRDGRAGPQYIFVTPDAEILQAMGPSGETHVATAEAILSALLAHQPPPYEQIVTASEAYKAWQAQQDPQNIYVYVLSHVWSIIAKTDVFSLPQHGFYLPFSPQSIGDLGYEPSMHKPSMHDLLEWAIKGVGFLRGTQTMTLCWEYTRGVLHYYLI